jgi:hypothetical protein
VFYWAIFRTLGGRHCDVGYTRRLPLSRLVLSELEVLRPYVKQTAPHIEPDVAWLRIGVHGLIVPLYNPTPLYWKSGPFPGVRRRHPGPALTIG